MRKYIKATPVFLQAFYNNMLWGWFAALFFLNVVYFKWPKCKLNFCRFLQTINVDIFLRVKFFFNFDCLKTIPAEVNHCFEHKSTILKLKHFCPDGLDQIFFMNKWAVEYTNWFPKMIFRWFLWTGKILTEYRKPVALFGMLILFLNYLSSKDNVH